MEQTSPQLEITLAIVAPHYRGSEFTQSPGMSEFRERWILGPFLKPGGPRWSFLKGVLGLFAPGREWGFHDPRRVRTRFPKAAGEKQGSAEG